MKRFPVLWQLRREDEQRAIAAGMPRSVPWSLLAPHEAQAVRNHDQSLARLAERGGLSPCEMIAVIEGRSWRRMPLEDAIRRLNEIVSAHGGEP